MKTVHVNISLPAELVEQAKEADINISKACREALQSRIDGEAVKVPGLVSRVELLEEQIDELLTWRGRVRE